MSDAQDFDQAVQNASFAADSVAIGFSGTPAEKTRAVIARALEALEANGIIEINPSAEWPAYFVADPPYRNAFAP